MNCHSPNTETNFVPTPSSFKFMSHGGKRKGAGRKNVELDEPAHTALVKVERPRPIPSHAGLSDGTGSILVADYGLENN